MDLAAPPALAPSPFWDSLAENIDGWIHSCQLQEKLEKAEARIRAREAFFSFVCHDLRSPLAVAKMGVDLMRMTPGDPAAIQSLSDRTLASLGKINQMLCHLLDSSFLLADGGVQLRRAETNLPQVVQQKIEEMEFLYGRRYLYAGEEECGGLWDAPLLSRAVENLLSNAHKYGCPHSPITVRVKRAEPYAVISVHNLGNPIPAELLAHLFQGNRRLPAPGSAKGSWGLGLQLVKSVAEAHGGLVEAESSADAGTTFRIFLP